MGEVAKMNKPKLTKENVRKAFFGKNEKLGYNDSLALLGLLSVEVAKNKKLSRRLVKLLSEVLTDECKEWRSQQLKEGKRIVKECRERGITRLQYELEQLGVIKKR